MPVLQVNSRSIDQKSGEIWTAQADLQPISFKSDRLLGLTGWQETSSRLAGDPVADCVADQFGIAVQVEFLHDTGFVGAHGFHAQ